MKIYQRATVIGLAVLLALCLFFTIIIEGNATTDRYSSNNYAKIYYVDNETGVNYIIFQHYSTGNVGVCPRYNADGSLYVTP
jgi:hypothetical protein